MSEFADSQVVYRPLGAAGLWGSYRLLVGGRDVTMFRGKPTQIGSYTLTDPYGYGPASFSLPQITSLEVAKFGTETPLKWFDAGKEVRLVKVGADGMAKRIIWRGFIAQMTPTMNGTDIECAGWASGRLQALVHSTQLFYFVKDVGTWLFEEFTRAGLTPRPVFGLKTGVRISARAEAGTGLTFCDSMLAQAVDADGRQLTVMPSGLRFVQQWRDETTTDFTVFNGAALAEGGGGLEVTRDLMEEPTTIFGQGREPASGSIAESLMWENRKTPGLTQAPAPDFPGTLSPGDSGDAVDTLQSKLFGMGYLDRADQVGGYNTATERAVRDLQDEAGLSVTGVVNEATWNALFDLADTGLSIRQAYRAPLAQLSSRRRYNRTANGSRAGANPNYRQQLVDVQVDLDFGSMTKQRATRMAKRRLAKVHDGKNWIGTLTFGPGMGAWKGEHLHTDAPGEVMSALDINAGMNVKVRHFDGVTRFHISRVTVSGDLRVVCDVDTKARSALEVAQIRQSNAESRRSPQRAWMQAHRGTDANRAVVEFSETGGLVSTRIPLEGGKWNVFPVIAGQSGSVNRIGLSLDGRTEFVVAAFSKRVGPGYLRRMIGNPFDLDGPVSSISVTDGGSSYESAPKVTVSGGGGRGARAVAVVRDGKVVRVRLTRSGRGYESAPSVSFSGGGGSGASAQANLPATGDSRWQSAEVQDAIDSRLLLNAWGTAEQPCGYHPGKKTGDDGEPTGAKLTGDFLDSGGFDYWTFDQPVIYIAVYPREDAVVRPQRVLWPVLDAGT